MPMVRISLPAGKDAGFAKGVSDAVQDAMVATIDVPAADRFHVISDHAPERLIIDPTYLSVERSTAALIVEITMRGGRTVEKKALYRTIADNLHARLDVDPSPSRFARHLSPEGRGTQAGEAPASRQ